MNLFVSLCILRLWICWEDKRAGISKIFMSFSDPPPRFCQRSISIQIYTNIFAITIKMNTFLVILS